MRIGNWRRYERYRHQRIRQQYPLKKREFPNLSARQYRIAQGFDSAAALVTSCGIQAAAAEERFTGEKATGTFPLGAGTLCSLHRLSRASARVSPLMWRYAIFSTARRLQRSRNKCEAFASRKRFSSNNRFLALYEITIKLREAKVAVRAVPDLPKSTISSATSMRFALSKWNPDQMKRHSRGKAP